MNYTRLREDLERFEGKRRELYDDRTGLRVKAPRGHLSGGIGHNFDEPLPDQIITAIYQYDIAAATRAAAAFLPTGGFITLNDVRQEVLVQMAFQLGEPVLREFVKFRQAIIQGKHDDAAGHMLASRWHEQTPARATKLADWWRTGER